MIPEAELVPTERGLVPKGEGCETTESPAAYARFGPSEPAAYRNGWL